MPPGALVTVPTPPPVRFTVRSWGLRANVAVTLRAWLIAVTQVPVPLQPPPVQPPNTESPAGVAVSVTDVLNGYVALHAVPHEMPPGVLVTVPVPLPARATVSVCVGTTYVNPCVRVPLRLQ
jgi:hypothetical protein